MVKWNPGFKYYDYILSKLTYDNIYIASDTPTHTIIKSIENKYKNVIILHDIVNIFKFSSTCRYIILSYGSFSAIIGYISFYSDVYYLKRCKQIAWDWKETNNDMCVDKSTKVSKWIEINMLDEYESLLK